MQDVLNTNSSNQAQIAGKALKASAEAWHGMQQQGFAQDVHVS